ncbi:cytochrome P450 [Pluteus cervinus]|uniref:Cytochrome P450 n=1 Tax=Pluteus cervinus TaxID=181527 RepID=A0ACD3B523_9AGAR|nr:cytochrome P450 [Pluteus cervinus]
MPAISDFSWWPIELCITVGLLGVTAFLYRRIKPGHLPYPPGPKGLPVVGMMLSFPQDQPWIKFKEWSKEYGSDIISLKVLGKRIVVLNSHATTQELMTKRSAIYSDRPDLPMLNDLQGWNWNFGFMRYNVTWKEHRKLLTREVQNTLANSAQHYAISATRRLLGSILISPENYAAHLKHLTGYFTLSIAYGLDIKPSGDPYVAIADKANEGLAKAGSLPSYLVDAIPSLKYLPEWFPGAKFKRDARVWAKFARALREDGFRIAKERYVKGIIKPCVASRGLERIRGDSDQEDQEENLKSVLGVFYSAGVDTSVSALATFVLAMVLHPEVQQTAHMAILQAVGHDRLPEFDDIQSVPYLHAVVREVLRWNPVIPMAIPHATTTDDVYDGYFIPKGSTVVGNAWAILRDETIFGGDTHLFKPERFLTEDGSILNPAVPNPEMAFGFGRRACPGRFLAYRLLLITTASLLHSFEIVKAKAKDGTDISPAVAYTTGMIRFVGPSADNMSGPLTESRCSFPKPFACDFKVRSAKLRELILETSKAVENRTS